MMEVPMIGDVQATVRRLIIAWMVTLAGASVVAAAPEAAVYELQMRHAVMQQAKKNDAGNGQLCDLQVYFRAPKEGAAVATGFALNFSKAIHEGTVSRLSSQGDAISLRLAMRMAGDAWIRDGYGQYQIMLREQGEDRYVGTFDGVYDGKVIQGPVELRLLRRPAPPEGFEPVGSKEHPRLLFRTADVPRLQQRLRSDHPVLKAAWKQIQASDDPVALGLRYRLTGDAALAESATAGVKRLMADRNAGSGNERGYLWADRLVSVSLAYDLCAAGWSDEFRGSVEEYIVWLSDRLVNRSPTIADRAYWSTYSRFVAHMHGGGAIGALTLAGHTGNEPQEPSRPEKQVPVVGAPADYKADELQVQPLKLSQTPDWLATAPLDPGTRLEIVPASVRGPEIVIGDQRLRLTPVKEDFYRSDAYTKGRAVDLGKLTSRRLMHVLYLVAVVKNDETRYLRMDMNQAEAQAELLIGAPPRVLRQGDIVRLEAGVYPVVVRVELGKPAQAWAGIWVAPRFEQVTEEHAAEDLAKRQAGYEFIHARWAQRRSIWLAGGGIDPSLALNSERAMFQMIRFYRSAYGTGGYQVEGEESTLRTMLHPLEYELAYRTMYGMPVTPEADVEALAPRYLMTTVFSKDGAEVNQSFSVSNGTMDASHYARAWALTAEQYRPAVQWAWNRSMGLPEQVRIPDVRTAIYTWLHYPVQGEPREPGALMPRVWHAETKGLVVFRNRFEDSDDIVFQLHAKGPVSGGQHYFDAGSLRLHGLGHAWAFVGIHSPNQGIRQMEPVVHLPGVDSNVSLPGKITNVSADERTGSGSATVDLGLLFTNRHEGTSRGALVSLDGRILDELLVKTGIEATRTVAADYSGKSGSPALFVLVDRVTGGGKKVWHWQLPDLFDSENRPLEGVSLRIDGGAFTIKQGDASLRGTSVSPARVMLTHERGMVDYRWYQTPKQAKMNALTATVPDSIEDQPFVWVLTLQRGEAPRVTSDQQGDVTTIRVGGQVVRVQGDRVMFTQE